MDGEASRKTGRKIRRIAFTYAVKRGRAIVRISYVSLNRHTSDDRKQRTFVRLSMQCNSVNKRSRTEEREEERVGERERDSRV